MLAKCRVPILIQDWSRGGSFEELTQDYDIEEPFFADGPVTRRLAVVDSTPSPGLGRSRSGSTRGRRPPPVPLRPPCGARGDHVRGLPRDQRVRGRDPDDAHVRARGGPGPAASRGASTDRRALIVPRAGVKANAFYERQSRSLQFFEFAADGRDIFLSLSRDVVAHETGHAILDGLARDLYNSLRRRVSRCTKDGRHHWGAYRPEPRRAARRRSSSRTHGQLGCRPPPSRTSRRSSARRRTRLTRPRRCDRW